MKILYFCILIDIYIYRIFFSVFYYTSENIEDAFLCWNLAIFYLLDYGVSFVLRS